MVTRHHLCLVLTSTWTCPAISSVHWWVVAASCLNVALLLWTHRLAELLYAWHNPNVPLKQYLDILVAGDYPSASLLIWQSNIQHMSFFQYVGILLRVSHLLQEHALWVGIVLGLSCLVWACQTQTELPLTGTMVNSGPTVDMTGIIQLQRSDSKFAAILIISHCLGIQAKPRYMVCYVCFLVPMIVLPNIYKGS